MYCSQPELKKKGNLCWKKQNINFQIVYFRIFGFDFKFWFYFILYEIKTIICKCDQKDVMCIKHIPLNTLLYFICFANIVKLNFMQGPNILFINRDIWIESKVQITFLLNVSTLFVVNTKFRNCTGTGYFGTYLYYSKLKKKKKK